MSGQLAVYQREIRYGSARVTSALRRGDTESTEFLIYGLFSSMLKTLAYINDVRFTSYTGFVPLLPRLKRQPASFKELAQAVSYSKFESPQLLRQLIQDVNQEFDTLLAKEG